MSRKYQPSQFTDPAGSIIDSPAAANRGLIGTSAGTPTSTTNPNCELGGLVFDTTNGRLYINVGTVATPVYSRFDPGGLTGVNGVLAVTDRITTTDAVSSGTARVVGGLAYSNAAASTAVSATTTAAQAYDVSYTIPANTLKAGTVVKVRAQGRATTTTSTDGVAYTLYIGGTGGTALISAGNTDAVDAHTFQMECTLVQRTVGTTGAYVSTGTYKVSSAEGTMTVKDDITSATLNNASNQALVVASTWNVSNTTNSTILDILTVEIY